MPVRKVFTSSEGKELSALILEGDQLYIEIKDKSEEIFIVLQGDDTIDFIMELYRLKRKIG